MTKDDSGSIDDMEKKVKEFISPSTKDKALFKFIEKCKQILLINEPEKQWEFRNACIFKNYKEIIRFIKEGLNIENKDLKNNINSLIDTNVYWLLKYLIEKCIKNETVDKIKEEIFLHAVEEGNFRIVRFFLTKGVSPCAMDNDALYICALRGDEEMLKCLQSFDKNIIYWKDKDDICLYIKSQNIVIKDGIEMSFSEFKKTTLKYTTK